MKTNKKGFTLPEIMITVSILALLITLVIPSLTASRIRAANRVCQNNLSLIHRALEQYMIIEGLNPSADATGVYASLITGNANAYIEEEPVTPFGELSYTITTFGAMPTCPNRDNDPTDNTYENHLIQ